MAGEAGSIDRLSIEIGASSAQAVGSINKLAEALKNLKPALNGLDKNSVGKLQSLASALKSLSRVNTGNIKISSTLGKNIASLVEATKDIDNIEPTKFERLANALKNLEGLGSINVSSKIGTNIADLAAGLDLTSDEHIVRLFRIGSALRSLDGIKIGIGDKLAGQLTNIAEAVDKISDETIAKIDRLTKALSRLQGIDFKGFSSAVKSAKNAVGQTSTALVPTNRQSEDDIHANAMEFLRNNNSSSDLLRDLSQIGKTFASNIVPGAKAFLSVLKSAANLVKKILSSIVNLAKNLTKASLNFAKSIAGAAKNKIKDFIDKHAFNDLKKFTGAIKNFLKSLGRIAFYRLIRSMIREITQAFQEGLQNAYTFSAGIEGEAHRFAAAMDSMKAAGGTMKNQLGSAFISLLAIIAPIVNTIISLITKLANALSMLFSAFTGGTYLKAKNLNAEMAADTAGGAAAAKEWKNQILGFDEINRLEDQDSGGGGGGGGADFGDLFDPTQIPQNIMDFVQAIKDAINNGDWEGVGTLIADKLNSMIPSAEQVSAWAHKLGYALNGAIQSLYFLIKKTDFELIGERIATFINETIEEVGDDFTYFGRLWMSLKLWIWRTVISAIANVKWNLVATAISNFIIGALDELAEFISSLEPDKIAQALKDFFGNINWVGIASSLWNVLKKAFEVVTMTLEALLPYEFSDVGKDIGKGIDTPANGLAVAESLKRMLSHAFLGIATLIASLLPDGLGDKVIAGIQAKIDANGGTLPITESVKILLTTAFNALTSVIASLLPPDLGKKVIEGIQNKISGGKEGQDVSGIKTAVETLISTALNTLAYGIASLLPDGLNTAFQTAIAQSIENSSDSTGGGTSTNVIAEAAKNLISTSLTGLTAIIAGLIDPTVGTEVADQISKSIRGEDGGANELNVGDAIKRLIAAAAIGLMKLTGIIPSQLGDDVCQSIADVISNADFTAIHNLLQYKIDAAVFGEGYANWTWLDLKGEYAGREIIEAIVGGVTRGLNENSKDIHQYSDNLGDAAVDGVVSGVTGGRAQIETAIDQNIVQPLEDANIETANLVTDVTGAGTELKDKLDGMKTATSSATEEIGGDLSALDTDASTILDDLQTACDDAGTSVTGMSSTFSGAFADVRRYAKQTSNNVGGNLGTISSAAGDTGSAISLLNTGGSSAMSSLSGSVAGSAGGIVGSMMSIVSAANAAYAALSRVTAVRSVKSNFAAGPTIVKTTSFASGGFPEDGLFMANHGEIVGQFSNGRTAVANNEQITEGIAKATYAAFIQAFSDTNGGGGQGGDHRVSISVNGREFVRAVYDDMMAVERERGVSLVNNAY